MSMAHSHPRKLPPREKPQPRGMASFLSDEGPDDLVAQALRESARRMVGVAVFSGVINILMLSGSLYMLQVYDRVIPSRNIATLLGLSLMVLYRLSGAGIFRRDAGADAVPDRHAVRRRPAGIDSRCTGDPAAARRKAGADAAAVARSRSGARLHVEHGADGVPGYAVDPAFSRRRCFCFIRRSASRRCSAPRRSLR